MLGRVKAEDKMQEQSFSYSETTMRKKKEAFITSALIMPFAIFAFAYFLTYFTYLIALITILLFLVIEFLLYKKMFADFNDTQINIGQEYIERKIGKTREKYLFSDIKDIFISQTSSKEIISISFKDSKKSISIAGFENMNDLAERILNNASEKNVQYKTQQTFKINTSLLIIVSAIFTTFVIIALNKIDNISYDFFSNVFGMLIGMYFFFFAPISKSLGAKQRRFELYGGGFLFIFNAASLLRQLF